VEIREIADLIERFMSEDNVIDLWEWDDFISVPSSDKDIEAIRRKIIQIGREHPPEFRGEWCSNKGFDALGDLAENIRAGRPI